MSKLLEWVAEEAGEKLVEMGEWGVEVHGCDLAFKVFEECNINGSYTCNSWKAREWVKEHFCDIGRVMDEHEGEEMITANPFSEPEKFMVQVILTLASDMFGACKSVQRFWDKETKITKHRAMTIATELKGVDIW